MAFKDIRKSRKWLSPQEIRIIAAFLIILVALLALNVYLARTLPGGEWLFMRWNAVHAFLGEGAETSGGLRGWRSMPEGDAVLQEAESNIYGGSIARRVQQIVYDRIAFADEYKYILSDPFYILLLYTPLGVFQNFPLTRGIWMLVAEIALFMSVLFSHRLSEWDPPLGLNLILISFGLLSFFSLNALVTSSPAIFLNFLFIGILLALRSSSDELAGALLALAAYQWEVGGLFYLCILIYVLANRRWGVLAGLGMALVVLLFVSFLIDSSWGLPYIRAVLSNLLQGTQLDAGNVLAGWFPEIPFPIGRVVSILLIAVVFFESLWAVNAPFRRVVWVASLALAAMPLAGLAIFPSNYVVLILPLVLVISLIWERWLRRRFIVVVLILFAAFLVPYYLYFETVLVYTPFYTELLTVLPSVVMIIALYWMRWWVIHSPRIWADRIGNRR
ncbi:MAG TPA: hypothetical protein VJ785_17880 [Anaerolineales bacterium]|nr:hypothetical protein [Anaerolineales bacterium]